MAKAAHKAHAKVKSNQVDPETTATWFNNLVKDVESGKHDWNLYDKDTPVIVSTYNANLGATPGYRPLDWRLIKAMTWVESGPTARDDGWLRRPMQIGDPKDPGLDALLGPPPNQAAHGALILPPLYKQTLTKSLARTNGRYNIIAGVGYLLQRFAIFDTIPAQRSSMLDFMKSTEEASLVLASVHSTRHPAQHSTTHHEASPQHQPPPTPKTKLAIVGWRLLTAETIGKLYNTKMSDYGDRLDWCYRYIKGEIK